jgi:hypothetical protein
MLLGCCADMTPVEHHICCQGGSSLHDYLLVLLAILLNYADTM